MIITTAIVINTLLVFLHPNFNYKVSVTAQINSENASSFTLSNWVEQGSPYIGNLSAPITIIDFSDFQCHLCVKDVKNTILYFGTSL